MLSQAICWLLEYPLTLKRLQDELDEHFGAPQSDSLDPEYPIAKLNTLPYLNAVLEESLRLGGRIPGPPRMVPEEGFTIIRHFIPAGTVVSIPSRTMNTSEQYFSPDPCVFRPERWLEGGLGPGSICSRSAVMTFSFGEWCATI